MDESEARGRAVVRIGSRAPTDGFRARVAAVQGLVDVAYTVPVPEAFGRGRAALVVRL